MGLVYRDLKHSNKIEKRKSIIVWLYHARDQFKLRHYGDIVYFSRKNGYVIIYVDNKQIDPIIKELEHKSFVKKVEKSHHENLNFSAEYENKLMEEMRVEAEKMLENGDSLN